MKKDLLTVSLFLAALTIGLPAFGAYSKTIYMGTLQFPKSFKGEIPEVRVYCCGHKIKTQVVGRKRTFDIPFEKDHTMLTIIITESINWEILEENTIKYLTIPRGKPYKWYSLALQPSSGVRNGQPSTEPSPSWITREIKGHLTDGRIPDDAIIICFNPAYIAGLKGGDAINLPRIMIKDDILQLAGSAKQLEDTSIKLMLSALDTDAVHVHIKQEIKQDQHRIRIVS